MRLGCVRWGRSQFISAMIVAAFRIEDIGSRLSILVASFEGFYNCSSELYLDDSGGGVD